MIIALWFNYEMLRSISHPFDDARRDEEIISVEEPGYAVSV